MFYRDLGQIEAFIYNRKSTDEKDRQILSLGDQSENNRKTLSRFKTSSVEEFTESESAKKANRRPIFSDMLKKIRSRKKPVWIFCWSVDRLSRNALESALIMMLMEEGKIEGIVTSQRIYHRQDNVLFLAIDFASAEQYSRDLSRNVKRGMESKVSKGGWVTLAPFGYVNTGKLVNGKIVDKIVEIDKTLLPYFKEMKKMKLNGKSYDEISEVMFKAGMRSKRGKKMRKGKIQKIFTNPFYAGFIYYNDQLIQANHTPMWTIQDYKSWQNKKEYNSHRGSNYAFSRILFCGNCKHMLSGFLAKKKYMHWKCSNCPFSVSQVIIEGLIAKEVEKFKLTPTEAYEMMKDIQGEAERDADEEMIESMKQKLKSIQQKRSHVYTMRENNEISGERFKERDEELLMEEKNVEGAIKKAQKKLKSAPEKIQLLKLLIFLYQYYLAAEPDIKGHVAKMISSNWIITKENALPEALSDDFRRILTLKRSSGAPDRTQRKLLRELSESLFSDDCAFLQLQSLPDYPQQQ